MLRDFGSDGNRNFGELVVKRRKAVKQNARSRWNLEPGLAV